MRQTEIAYIAGFFDGEGCVMISHPRATKNGKRYARLVATITQQNREVLDWIVETVGLGYVTPKDPAAVGRDGCSRFSVASRSAEVFLRLIRPYLQVKAQAVDLALEQRAKALIRRTP